MDTNSTVRKIFMIKHKALNRYDIYAIIESTANRQNGKIRLL